MGGWGATPEPSRYFLTLWGSKTPVPGSQTHIFWPMVCSVKGGWVATLELTLQCLALCCSLTPSLGIHQHLFWPLVCWRMGGWGATPDFTLLFLVLCSPKTLSLRIQKLLFLSRGVHRYGWLMRNPKTQTILFLHCAFQRHPSYESKNTASGPWCAQVWVVGVPPQNPHNSFRRSSKTHAP